MVEKYEFLLLFNQNLLKFHIQLNYFKTKIYKIPINPKRTADIFMANTLFNDNIKVACFCSKS